MFKSLIVAFLALGCNAVPLGSYGGGYGGGLSLGGLYGGGLALGGGYGGGLALSGGYGLGGGLGGYGGYGLGGGIGLGYGGSYGGGYGGGRVNAAILSTRSVNVVPVASNYGSAAPTVVDIDSSEQPVLLNFNSRSSPLAVTQNHYGQPGSRQATSSVDEPHILSHEVTRPVIQEVREVIVPSRNIVQEIRPVQENVQTLVARGEGRALSGGSGLALGGGYGGSGLLLDGGYGGAGLGLAGGYGGKGLALSGGYGGSIGYGGALGLSGKGYSKGY